MELGNNYTFSNISLLLIPTNDNRRLWLANLIIACSIILLAALAFVGNAVIITLVSRDYELRNQVSNVMILNLAVVDAITAVTVMLPSSVAVLADTWPFPEICCTAHVLANYVCMGLSLLSITALSVDRAISVAFPLHYSTLVTHRRMLGILVLIYVTAFTFALNASLMGIVVYDYWEAVCAMDWFDSPRNAKISIIVGFVILFVIPSLLILGSNCYIVFLANSKPTVPSLPAGVATLVNSTVNHSENRPVPTQHQICSATTATGDQLRGTISLSEQINIPKGRKQRRIYLNRAFDHNATAKRVFNSILTVTICFFVCLTPYSVIKFTKMMTNDRNVIPNEITLFGTILQITNSMINPFIYGILRKDFRRAFWRFKNRYWRR